MTRLLYVGNLSENHVPKTPGFSPEYSTENHVKRALRNLGHECLPVLEVGLDWSTLPGVINQTQPDVFLWTRTSSFDPADLSQQTKVLEHLRSVGIPSVFFHLDRWWGLHKSAGGDDRERHLYRSPAFKCDWLFTADGGHDEEWKSIGANHVWSPPAILSDEAKRVGVFREEYATDVGFVGNLRKYGHLEWQPYRHSLYRFLSLTYRGRFKLWEGGIRGRDLADLYRSVKVLIGDSCLAGNPSNYWSDRVPETLGRGGFLIHPEVEGLSEAYPALISYPLGDFDQLGSLIDHFLANSGERLANAEFNRQWVLDRHTYERRLERLLGIVL